MLPKLCFLVNLNPTDILKTFLVEIDKLILKYRWKSKKFTTKPFLKKNRIKFLSLKLSKLQEPIMFINDMRRRAMINTGLAA